MRRRRYSCPPEPLAPEAGTDVGTTERTADLGFLGGYRYRALDGCDHPAYAHIAMGGRAVCAVCGQFL